MKRKQLTRHHMIPVSRGGFRGDWNIKMITLEEHRAFHELFHNKLPQEIILEILNFWTPQNMRRDTLLAVIMQELGSETVL